MMLSGYIDMTIPPPSILTNYIDNDADYITDPDKVRDALPQPFRLINKIVDFTFDIAWEEIIKREQQRYADSLRIRPPKYECQKMSKVAGARSVVSSDDGEFVFIGTTSGVTVIKSKTGDIVDHYTEDGVIISEISTSTLEPGMYVISTVDKEGLARLFVFNGDSITLAKILNETEINSGSFAHKIFISNETDYIAIFLMNQTTGEAWIDFHRVPKDLWIKEAGVLKEKSPQQKVEEPVFTTEPADSENTSPEVPADTTESPLPHEPAATQESKSQSNFRFSNTTIFLKVKAPTPMKPCSAGIAFQAFKPIDSTPDVIATGQNHIFSANHMEGRQTVFKSYHKDLIQYLSNDDQPDPPPTPVIHFITATRMAPQGFDSGKPTSVLIRWQNGNQIYTYSLVKQAKDINYRPDLVWPLPHQITTTVTSPCSQLLAVGLSNGSVLIWDLFTNLQRRLVSVTPGTAVAQVAFMDPGLCRPHSASSFQSHLPYQTQTSGLILVLSENGQLSSCDTTMGLVQNTTKRIICDELDSRMEKFSILPELPDLVLGTFGDGKIYLLDVMKSEYICQVVTPEQYPMDEDCLGTVAHRGKTIMCKAVAPSENEQDQLPAEDTDVDGDGEITREQEQEPAKTVLFLLQCLKLQQLAAHHQSGRTSVSDYVLHTTVDRRLDALTAGRTHEQAARQARLVNVWHGMGDTLDQILRNKEQERPASTTSRYADSTVLGSEGGRPESRTA